MNDSNNNEILSNDKLMFYCDISTASEPKNSFKFNHVTSAFKSGIHVNFENRISKFQYESVNNKIYITYGKMLKLLRG